MKKKEKAVKAPWCPLTGDIEPHDNLILRARDLLGVRDIVEDNIVHAYRPDKAVIERARKIYNRWDEYNHDPLRIEILELNLSMALDPGRRGQARKESLQDIMMLFYEIDDSGKKVFIDVSEQEVFSVLAIYEARVSKNPAWPLELLMIAEKYSPKAKRGEAFSERQSESGKLRWDKEAIEKEKNAWLAMAKEYREKHPDKKLHSKRRIAKHVQKSLALPDKSFSSIYACMRDNDV